MLRSARAGRTGAPSGGAALGVGAATASAVSAAGSAGSGAVVPRAAGSGARSAGLDATFGPLSPRSRERDASAFPRIGGATVASLAAAEPAAGSPAVGCRLSDSASPAASTDGGRAAACNGAGSGLVRPAGPASAGEGTAPAASSTGVGLARKVASRPACPADSDPRSSAAPAKRLAGSPSSGKSAPAEDVGWAASRAVRVGAESSAIKTSNAAAGPSGDAVAAGPALGPAVGIAAALSTGADILGSDGVQGACCAGIVRPVLSNVRAKPLFHCKN